MEAQEAKKKPGRPFGTRRRKFTEETIATVLKGIRMCLTYKTSAINAGISEATFNVWMNKGRDGVKGYVEFLASVEEATEQATVRLAGLVQRHAEGGKIIRKTSTRTHPDGSVEVTVMEEEKEPSLKAAMWILERRRPKDWGMKQEVAVVNGANPFQVSLFGQALPGSGTKLEDE